MSANDPNRTWPSLQCDDAAIATNGHSAIALARNRLVGIGFSFNAGFHVSRRSKAMERRAFLVGGAFTVAGMATGPVSAQYFDNAWVKSPPQQPLSPADIESAVARLRKQFLAEFDAAYVENVMPIPTRRFRAKAIADGQGGMSEKCQKRTFGDLGSCPCRIITPSFGSSA